MEPDAGVSGLSSGAEGCACGAAAFEVGFSPSESAWLKVVGAGADLSVAGVGCAEDWSEGGEILSISQPSRAKNRRDPRDPLTLPPPVPRGGR